MKKKKTSYRPPSGFKLPEEYFEGFEKRILAEIKALPISKQKVASGFMVPENYFDTVSNKVISTKGKANGFELINWPRTVRVASMAIAASMLAFVMFNLSASKDVQFADLNVRLMEEFIYEEDISATELAQLLDLSIDAKQITDFAEIEDSNLESYIIESINTDELIQYDNE